MNTETLQAQLTVEDILKKWPQAYAVFNSRNTACVGCMLQRFCTLQDVAETYNISLPNLVVDLKNYVNGNTQTIRRTQ
jgi:hybrid cluster-associated redox disulfide protein